MKTDQQHVPFDGTTYKFVVEKSESVEELLENLYQFVLNQPLKLAKRSSIEQIANAVTEFIVQFISAVNQSKIDSPNADPFEQAVNILRELRKPNENAKIHTQTGIRHRIGQLLLKKEHQHQAIHLTDKLDQFAAKTQLHDSEIERLPVSVEAAINDLTSYVDKIIENRWTTIRAEILQKLKTQVHVVRRRALILDILENHSRTQFRRIGSRYLEMALELKPREIIAEVLASNTIRTKGRHKVTQQQLRHDIRQVKDKLGQGIEELKDIERETRSEVADIIDNLKIIESKLSVQYSLKWAERRIRKLIELASAA